MTTTTQEGTKMNIDYKPCDLHGISSCPICYKREGECDFGSCTEPATARIIVPGRRAESNGRPMCARHGAFTLTGVLTPAVKS